MAERSRPPDARSYGDEEVARLLHRASALDRKRQQDAGAGLSLAEVEAIARESGIDPSLVRQAARDLDAEQASGFSRRFLGAPTRMSIERVVEGEISVDDHERMAAEIRRLVAPMGSMPSQITSLGRSLSYTAWTGAGAVEVSVTPRDGRTLIRIDANATPLAGGLFGGIMGGIGGGLGANVAWLIPVALHLPVAAGLLGLAGVVGGAYALARSIFSAKVNAFHHRLEQLADALESQVSRPRP